MLFGIYIYIYIYISTFLLVQVLSVITGMTHVKM